MTYQETEDKTPVAQDIKATVTTKDGGLTVTGNWKQVTNVNDKTEFTANGNFIGTLTDVATGMAQADQKEVPELTVNAPSLKGKADGSITGLTTDMEYTTTKDGEYTAVPEDTTEWTGLVWPLAPPTMCATRRP